MDKKNRKHGHNAAKKLLTSLSTTVQKMTPKVIILSKIFSTKHEIEILSLGLSCTLTPKHNISELETNTMFLSES